MLTYKSTLGYFIAGSFGSSMVLLFGFPESPFAQPKNVFFGHLVTTIVGVVFVTFVPISDMCGMHTCKGFTCVRATHVNFVYTLTKILNPPVQKSLTPPLINPLVSTLEQGTLRMQNPTP